jgi:class 3 adenylate cyclase
VRSHSIDNTARPGSRPRLACLGKAVNTAARVMTLAAGGQIVASDSLAAACGPRAGEVRSVELKGLGAPTTVVTVDWQH